MSRRTITVTREDHARISSILDRLLAATGAKAVFLANGNGEHIAAAGSVQGMDPTSIGSLAAGSVAAIRSLARLIGEQEFSVLFHEGKREHLHISHITENAILLIHFDGRTTLGLVRLRVRAVASELAPIFEGIHARSEARDRAVPRSSGTLGGITDDEIEALLR